MEETIGEEEPMIHIQKWYYKTFWSYLSQTIGICKRFGFFFFYSPVTLHLADNIDGLAVQEWELVKLVNHLEEASTAYGMQISAEKTQLMTKNTNGISTDITIDNKKLETLCSLQYLGAIVSDEGSKPGVPSRIAQITAAVTKLEVIWNDKNIAISFKVKLMHSLAMSIFLYACQTWTIRADIERRIQVLEMRCFRKLLGILYRDHIINEEVKARTGNAIGRYEDLLTAVKRVKLKWYELVTWSSGLAKTISYSKQFKEGDEEADRGNNGKTTSKNGLALNGISYYGKLRTGRNGGSW